MADQRDVVAELYKRMDSLPAEKQSVVRELAKRFRIPGTEGTPGPAKPPLPFGLRPGATELESIANKPIPETHSIASRATMEQEIPMGALDIAGGRPLTGMARIATPFALALPGAAALRSRNMGAGPQNTGGALPESKQASRLQTIKEGISAERAAQPKGILKPTATLKGAVKGAMAERLPAPPSKPFQRVTEPEAPQHTPEFEAAAARGPTEPGKGTKTKFGGRFEQKYGKPNPMPPARRARVEQFIPKPGEAAEGETGDIYKQHGQKRGGEIERASIAKDANLGRFLKKKGFTRQMLRDMKPDQWKIVMREINKAYGVDYRYTPGTASRIDEIAKFLPE